MNRGGCKVTNIYKEVMLNNIIYERCNCIRFEFYDAQTGSDLSSLTCRGVLLFRYSSTLLSDAEAFPYFSLDITEEKVDKNSIIEYLKSNNYSYHQVDGVPLITNSDVYSSFKIQGGEIDISVFCMEVIKATNS